MINIVISLFLFFAVKRGFLWVFVPRHDRDLAIANLARRPETAAVLVESHDRRPSGPSIRSEVHALAGLGTPDSDASAFSFRMAKQLVEER